MSFSFMHYLVTPWLFPRVVHLHGWLILYMPTDQDPLHAVITTSEME